MSSVGCLDIFIGSMFSGKTTKLVEKYKECVKNNVNVVAINYAGDTRYHNTLLSTHDKHMIPCIQCKLLEDVVNTDQVINSDVILINEGQFFVDIFEVVIRLVERDNKHVIVCGLDSDFKRTKFGNWADLTMFCDSITKLHAKCECGKPSIYSHRTSSELQQVVIGSCNYKPLCRRCYLNAATQDCSVELATSA